MNDVSKRCRRIAVLALAGLAVGTCSAGTQGVVTNNMFTAAGFVVQYADTPHKRALLARLPADRLVTRTYGGKTWYLYADHTLCQCAYVGTPQAYRNYQDGIVMTSPPGSGSSGLGIGSPEIAAQGRPVPDQTLGQFEENDEPAEPGAPTFNDFAFGGMRID